MKTMKNLVLSFMLVMLTTGCVATYQPPLNAENRAKINNLEAVTLVAQEEIDVQFIPSMAGASAGASYGIIGALVGSAIDASINDTRSKEAEIRAKPDRDMLLGYDYRPVLNEAVAKQVAGVQWTGDIIVTQDVQVEDFDVMTYQGQARDGIVFINSSYALSPAQDMVFVKAYIAVHERVDNPEGDKKLKNKPMAAWTLQYQSPARNDILNSYTEDDVQVDVRWDRDALIQELVRGADHLGYLAKFTLDDGLTKEEYLLKEQTMLVGPAKTEGKGFYLGEYDGNKIYRLGSGALHSVPADEGVAVNFLMAQ